MDKNARRAAAAVDGRMSGPEFANHLSHTLLRTARLLRQLGHDGISASQSTALMMIDRFGPLPISELATIENIARPTASSLVAKLEAEGYVRRREVPNDGRMSLIELTPRAGRSCGAPAPAATAGSRNGSGPAPPRNSTHCAPPPGSSTMSPLARNTPGTARIAARSR